LSGYVICRTEEPSSAGNQSTTIEQPSALMKPRSLQPMNVSHNLNIY
jgi:hypothetical protein